jgi:16S rRNA (uracil1498-N3)-methyltransferase
MAIFYTPKLTDKDKSFLLDEEESKHICKVLRMQSGDSIDLVNGNGLKAGASIIIADPRKCEVKITKSQTFEKPEKSIHIAIAPTKNIDRIEWFIEKATEIGIDEISFLLCDRSERKILKLERLEKIMISAFKQSQRHFIPKLNDLMAAKTFIKDNPNGMIAHCNDLMNEASFKKYSIQNYLKTQKSIVLIGPEGDFSMEEVKLALNNNYKAISLGSNRLRTETAALYATMQMKQFLDLV